MSEQILTEVASALKWAVFERKEAGMFQITGHPPDWVPALWPHLTETGGKLRPEISPFLENFLMDAETCWQAGGGKKTRSGPWIEEDSAGHTYHLQSTALSLAGTNILLIEELGAAYQERSFILQKAHEVTLAYERLERAEQALAEEKRSLERRVRERTAQLAQANETLMAEVAMRQNYADRLEAIHEIDKAILAAQSPEAIADATVRCLHRLIPCESAHLIELDPETERATVLARLAQGEITSGAGWHLTREQLRKARVLESGRLHRVKKALNLFGSAEPREKVWQFILDIPLIADETLIGVLNLATDLPNIFTPQREEIAMDLGIELAVALRQARLFTQVSEAREHSRTLSLRLVEVQEEERRFIARELHDEIGQALTGLKLTLEMSRREPPPQGATRVTDALGMLDELMHRVRRLSLDLRPQVLDDLGLLPALEWLFQRFSKQTGIRVDFRHTPLIGRLPTELETAAFRVTQEALTNAARHAGVREVIVRLWTDADCLGLQVEDRGVGFDAAKAQKARRSSGLTGMRERARLLDGSLTVDSAPGAGTRVTVELPLRAVPERKDA